MDEFHLFLIGIAIFLFGYLWNYKKRKYLKEELELHKAAETIRKNKKTIASLEDVDNMDESIRKGRGDPYKKDNRTGKYKDKVQGKIIEAKGDTEWTLKNRNSNYIALITEIIGLVIAVINLIKILKI